MTDRQRLDTGRLDGARAPDITAEFNAAFGAIEALMRAMPPQPLFITIGEGHPQLPPGRYEVEHDPDAPPVHEDGKLTISMIITARQCIGCGAIMGRPNPECLVCRTCGGKA